MTNLEIIFEDQDLVVVNKPAGLLSIPDRWDATKDSLYQLLQSKHPEIMVVHRLDKDTSGVIVFAKNAESHKSLNDQFSAKENHKLYWAIVQGQVIHPGTIDTPIAADPYQAGKMVVHRKGKESLTDYTPIENFKEYTLLEVRIHTGRTHQIRVHLSSIGYPLAMDPLYGNEHPITIDLIKKRHFRPSQEESTPLMARVPLHAIKLSLIHPTTHQAIEFEAPLPKDFKALLQQLRKWGK